jgi:hypothetical protein
MKRIFPFLFTFLLLYLTGCTAAGDTGYTQIDQDTAKEMMGISYGTFLSDTPAYNPRSELITGKVCGVQVEMIEDPLMKKVRQLDKLVDELSKGKPLEKILR